MNTPEYADERELTDAELETVNGGLHRHHHHFYFEEECEDRKDTPAPIIVVTLPGTTPVTTPATTG